MNGAAINLSSSSPIPWGYFSARQLFQGVSSSATSFLGVGIIKKATPIVDPFFFPREQALSIDRLFRFNLKTPLSFSLRKDGPGFLAKCHDLPLYGYDKNQKKAIIKLKKEIEELYFELESEQNFSEGWKEIHSFLKGIIIKK